MAGSELRFGIATVAGYRAATWKLWTDGPEDRPELYLACRPLGGHLKTSLHASGQWHTAYSKETFDAKVKGVASPGTDRFIQRWPRPGPLAPGVVLAFRIVTPSSAVTSRMTAEDTDVLWQPNAPEGQAREIDVILVAASTSVTGWPGKRSMGTSLVGSLQLARGDTAWVVHRVTDLPKSPSLPDGRFRFYRGRGPVDLAGANLRALAFGNEPDGSRVIYDFAVDASQRTTS
jgi:hypothetical protein